MDTGLLIFFTVITLIMTGVIVYLIIHNVGESHMREFDERQKAAQGVAAKCALIALIAYLFIAGIIDVITDVMWAPFIIEAFVGICLSLCLYASVCIFKDAYIAIRMQPKRMLLFIGGICVMNMGICLPYFFDGSDGFITDGLLNIHSMNLICVIMLFVVFWELVIKISINKRREARDE